MIIKIDGMSCMHCVKHVKEALEELAGVTKVEVSLEAKEATVEGEVSEAAVREAIDEVGYDIIEIR
ncbi:MAG: heavy-metal-associated domain-containing protein [Cellulosilyticaceae bacterium]